MVAFYDILDTIDMLLRDANDGGFTISTELDETYIPVLEGYLNLFCKPADCQFTLTKSIVNLRTKIEIKMTSLVTDRVFKK